MWSIWGNRLFNKAYAWIPQSTIGDMTNTALVNVYETMGHYTDLLIQVHDSLDMQIDPCNLTQGFVDDLTNAMVIPLEINGTKFSVPIDIEFGTSWKDATAWEDIKDDIPGFLKSKGF